MNLEVFDGNPLHLTYFRSMFRKAVEKKMKDPQEKLTRLINLASKVPKELVKPFFIHDSFANAMRLLEKQYCNPHKLLVVIRRSVVITS